MTSCRWPGCFGYAVSPDAEPDRDLPGEVRYLVDHDRARSSPAAPVAGRPAGTHENNVLKPVGKVPFREGERIRITVEKKLPFDPIQLKKKPSSARISSLKDESWTSS